MVEFRLLGDIGADAAGRPLELGHLRQRCVLAALLVDVDRVVPVDQLLDRVWGDRLPQRARGTLHSYLSRLRLVLAGVPDAVIARRPGGYQLIADPMTVDLHRFAHLTSRARAAGDTEVAAGLLAEALGLWRGEAFSMVDTPWIGTVRAAAQAQRLAAELDHNDLELSRGRHAALLGPVSELAAAHPLDERLAGQLMLALFRCGRPADALGGYQRLRFRLADELGADPGPALQRLHQQMLRNDPALDPPARDGPAPGGPAPGGLAPDGPGTPQAAPAAVPWQVPVPPGAFAGRCDDLAVLDAALAGPLGAGGPAVLATVCGAGGVGKTWLALRWAHDNRDRFPDGQLYVNLRGFDPGADPVSPVTAVRGFLDALGVHPGVVGVDADAQATLYRGLVGSRRMLVVLDNARDSEQVLPLLPGGAACRALVTSRHQLPSLVARHGARPVRLDVLADPAAADLLSRHLGAARVAAEPAAVATLLRRCAGLPLALGIVAARAAPHPALPLAALAAELDDAATRLDGLDAGEIEVDLRAVLACSYAALPDDAARLFALLGLAAGSDIALPAVAGLAGLDRRRAQALLRRLTAVHLVQEHAPGRYRMHDLVRLYAAEQGSRLGAAGECAVRRLIAGYRATAHHAALLLDPDRRPVLGELPVDGVVPRDYPEALAWFTAEHGALLAAVEQAASLGADQLTWQLAGSLTTYLDRRGRWADRARVQRAALAAARRAGDRAAEAHSRRGIAIADTWLGRYPEAEDQLWRALALFEILDDDDGRARTHRNLARVSARQGRHRDALPHDRQALSYFQAAGDRGGQARALNAIGWHLAHLGEPERALPYCRSALDLQQRLGNRPGEGLTWDSLGLIHRGRGADRLAAECFERAVALMREAGDRYFEASSLTRLGDARRDLGDPDAAHAAWRSAARILDGLHHPDAVAVRARMHRGAIGDEVLAGASP